MQCYTYCLDTCWTRPDWLYRPQVLKVFQDSFSVFGKWLDAITASVTLWILISPYRAFGYLYILFNYTCWTRPHCNSPWYNRTGWLGIKHTSLLTYHTVTVQTMSLKVFQGLFSVFGKWLAAVSDIVNIDQPMCVAHPSESIGDYLWELCQSQATHWVHQRRKLSTQTQKAKCCCLKKVCTCTYIYIYVCVCVMHRAVVCCSQHSFSLSWLKQTIIVIRIINQTCLQPAQFSWF